MSWRSASRSVRAARGLLQQLLVESLLLAVGGTICGVLAGRGRRPAALGHSAALACANPAPVRHRLAGRELRGGARDFGHARERRHSRAPGRERVARAGAAPRAAAVFASSPARRSGGCLIRGPRRGAALRPQPRPVRVDRSGIRHDADDPGDGKPLADGIWQRRQDSIGTSRAGSWRSGRCPASRRRPRRGRCRFRIDRFADTTSRGPTRGEKATVSYLYNAVTPDYFRAMGIPIRAGRAVSAGRSAQVPASSIVNQAFVDRYVKRSNPPVGATYVVTRRSATPYQIVGVGTSFATFTLGEDEQPQVYELWTRPAYASRRPCNFVLRPAGRRLPSSRPFRPRFAPRFRRRPRRLDAPRRAWGSRFCRARLAPR